MGKRKHLQSETGDGANPQQAHAAHVKEELMEEEAPQHRPDSNRRNEELKKSLQRANAHDGKAGTKKPRGMKAPGEAFHGSSGSANREESGNEEIGHRMTKSVLHPPVVTSNDGVSEDFISDDERSYFRAIRDDLNRVVSETDTGDSSAAVEEDYMMIWDRLESRETALCQDKELSFIVENLLRLTGTAGVTHLMSVFAGKSKDQPKLMEKLCSHFSASHVIETLLDGIAAFKSSDRDTTKRFTKAAKKFLTALLGRPSLFIASTHASHVAEKILLRLCRVKSYNMGNDGLVYEMIDPESGQPVNLRFAKDDSTSRKFSETVTRIGLCTDHDFVITVLLAFQEMLFGDTKPGNLAETLPVICRTEACSIIVQALVAVANILHVTMEDVPDSLWCWKRSEQGSTAPYFVDCIVQSFIELGSDKCASRVAEIFLGSCSAELFDAVLLRLYGEDAALENIIRDQYAHHSLVKSTLFATEVTQLVTITQSLKDHFSVILKIGHGMLLVKLAQKLGDENAKKSACGRHGSASEWNECQSTFLEALRKVYEELGPGDWTEVQRKENFVILVGALYPNNFRPTVQETTRNFCMAGSQILQALISFKDSAPITNSFLKMDKETLFDICNSPPGSYLVESLLESNRSRKGFYHPFVKKLSELASRLVFSKSGSRVFDYLWKTVDLKHREEITQTLSALEGKLKSHESARFLLPKLSLGLFKRSVDAWRQEQQKYQNQKDDLKNILDMINKEK